MAMAGRQPLTIQVVSSHPAALDLEAAPASRPAGHHQARTARSTAVALAVACLVVVALAACGRVRRVAPRADAASAVAMVVAPVPPVPYVSAPAVAVSRDAVAPAYASEPASKPSEVFPAYDWPYEKGEILDRYSSVAKASANAVKSAEDEGKLYTDVTYKEGAGSQVETLEKKLWKPAPVSAAAPPAQATAGATVDKKPSGNKGAWGYSDFDAWKAEFPACSGESQSPVSLDTLGAAKLGEDTIAGHVDYKPLGGRQIKNTGHGLQVDGNFGTLTLPDGTYEVKQFHVHFPAEHAVDGKLAAGELHIVHQKVGSSGTDDLAVVGVLLEPTGRLVADQTDHQPEVDFLDKLGFKTLPTEGGGFRPTLQFEKVMRNAGEAIDLAGDVDLNVFMPEMKGPFFHYYGSLTTPPCSQTVHWYVLRDAAAVSPQTVESFKGNFLEPTNNRPLQKLKDRTSEIGLIGLKGEFVS